MKRFIELYWTSIKFNLKSLYQYQFDFWVGMFALILLQGTGLGFIRVIFLYTPGLVGWRLEEVMFVYGLQEFVKALYVIMFGGTTGLEQLIRRGDFDRYMVRPVQPLCQLMFSKTDPKGFGSLITAGGILFYAVRQVNLQMSVSGLLIFILFIAAGSLVYFALALITSTCAFWFTRTLRLHQLVFDFSEFTRYPLDIFHTGVKLILSVAVPFALASYYPAVFFLKGTEQLVWAVAGICGGAIFFFALAYTFWNFGLRHYHSTGS